MKGEYFSPNRYSKYEYRLERDAETVNEKSTWKNRARRNLKEWKKKFSIRHSIRYFIIFNTNGFFHQIYIKYELFIRFTIYKQHLLSYYSGTYNRTII